MYKKYLAEFIGTFFLVFVGNVAIIINALSDNSLGHIGVSLAFGFIIFIMIFTFGDISGAHFNPAVSIAFYISSKIKILDVAFYIMSQLLGAMAASALLSVMFGKNSSLAITLPALGFFKEAVPVSIILEVIFTCLLIFVIMSVRNNPRVESSFAGLIIGLTVFLVGLVAGPISSGSFNPVRSLAPAIVSWDFRYIWLYILAPIIGAFIGSNLYVFARTNANTNESSLI